MKKVYKKPVLQSENLEFGVFGCYGGESKSFNYQYSWNNYFSWWSSAFSWFWGRGRRR